MSKSVVAIVQGTNHAELVEEALSLLGGANSMVTSKSKVFIMPNAGHKDPPESGVNTSPDMVNDFVAIEFLQTDAAIKFTAVENPSLQLLAGTALSKVQTPSAFSMPFTHVSKRLSAEFQNNLRF